MYSMPREESGLVRISKQQIIVLVIIQARVPTVSNLLKTTVDSLDIQSFIRI